MEISISSRHGSLSSETQTYIEKKLPKLSHLFERLTSIRVTVHFNKRDPLVELLVSAEHKHDFVARERAGTVESAFDNSIAKMEGQIRKYKEKIQEHHRRGLINPEPGGEPESVAGEES